MGDEYWTPDLSKPLSDSFTYDVGGHGWGNEELQTYTEDVDNAFINKETDAVVIRARAQTCHDGSSSFTSARLVSKQCLDYEQGYLEADIDVPHAKGIWYAFWLLPRKPFAWPSDGEVDIAEGWDGKRENGNCLHWGHFNGQDYAKHRVHYHPVRDGRNHYGFCWSKDGLIWYFNGKPTMHAKVPQGVRPWPDFQIVLNIAMGGNVLKGSRPHVPCLHEMVVRNLKMCHSPPGGWQTFETAWQQSREGETM